MNSKDAPTWLIKEMGRWKSDTFRLYTDPTWSNMLDHLYRLSHT